MNRLPVFSWVAPLCFLLSMLTACGGGSSASNGGATAPAPVAPAAVILSGQASAPNGIIASTDHTDSVIVRLLGNIIPSAHAALSGLTAIPNGTAVELCRIDSSGVVTDSIATTTIAAGSYSFNLTALGVSISNNLIVRVSNIATGAELRAFVTDESIDINPVSETVLRIVLDKIATTQNASLNNFTLTELLDLANSLDQLTSSINYQASPDIASTVLSLQNLVSNNAELTSFISAIAQSGQSSVGPGDLGNYFPFTQGVSWTYTITETEDGIPSTPYSNTVTINGTRLINGVSTTVFSESNPDGDGIAGNFFYRKTSNGVYDWTPVSDGLLSAPYRFVRFPATPGTSIQQSMGDLGLNTDIDEDGTIERFQFTATTSVDRMETVIVPAGSLANSLKILTTATSSTVISSTGENLDVTVTVTEWYTKNLGLSKQIFTLRASYGGEVWTDTRTQELTQVAGFPLAGDFPLNRWVSLNIETNDIVYEPVSGKLYASVPSSAASYADNVVVINPLTSQVEAAIPVGANPGPLAVSDNGQFLYVGLYGVQGSVRQISLANLTAGPEWMLSNLNGTSATRYPYDIAVQPGQPQVIAVSTCRTSDSCTIFAGAIILDNGTERPVNIPHGSLGPSVIEFSSNPSVAYGYNVQWRTSDLDVLSITSSGITISQTRANFISPGFLVFKFENGKIFTNEAKVFNASSGSLLGSYSPNFTGYARIEPVSALGRVAFAKNFGGIYLELYDMSTYSRLDGFSLSNNTYEYPTHVEHFGGDGYVIRALDNTRSYQTTSRLIFVRVEAAN